MFSIEWRCICLLEKTQHWQEFVHLVCFLRYMDVLEKPMRFMTLDLKVKLITSESICLGGAFVG